MSSAVARAASLSSSTSTFLIAARLATTAALLYAGAGCSDSPPGAGSGDGGGHGDASAVIGEAVMCDITDPGPLDYIDDMEDGDGRILVRQGRSATWYTYNDGTPSGSEIPVPGQTPAMEPIPGGRCGYSMHAMRVTGSGFSDWGAGFGFDLNVVSGASGWMRMPYSATAIGARGITFWARRGDPSIALMRVGVGDKWSDPAGGQCDQTITSGPLACYDAFGETLTLATTWTRYAFTWGQLQQRQFGLTRPELDTDNLFQVHFDVPVGPVFDVWIDDVAFFK